MQIHHVITSYTERFVLDPAQGPVKRREQIMKASDTMSLSRAGVEYERQEDGTFEVPVELGNFLLTHRDKAGTWHEGPSPFDPRLGEFYQDAAGQWHQRDAEPPKRGPGRPRKTEAAN